MTGSKVAQGPERRVRVDSIHLKQCVTLYLFALPFTLVGDLG
jgi:predicted membrane chloride channel (bestrophin family)